MALIKCRECGTEFSDTAPACPRCAAPIKFAKGDFGTNSGAGKAANHAGSSRSEEMVSGDSPLIIEAAIDEAFDRARRAFGAVGKVKLADAEQHRISGSIRDGIVSGKMTLTLQPIDESNTQVNISRPTGLWVMGQDKDQMVQLLSSAISEPDTIGDLLEQKRSRIIKEQAGNLGVVVCTLVAMWFWNEFKDTGSDAGNLANRNQQVESALASPKAGSRHLTFELKGEWVNDIFAPLLDANHLAKGHRILTLKGRMKNVSSEALRKITCPTEMTVEFTNGRSIQVKHDDICGETVMRRATGMEGIGNGLVVRPGEVHEFGGDNDQQALFAKLGQALAVSGEYTSYEVQSVRLAISLAAETVFGDRVRGRIVDASIRPPSEQSSFSIPGTR